VKLIAESSGQRSTATLTSGATEAIGAVITDAGAAVAEDRTIVIAVAIARAEVIASRLAKAAAARIVLEVEIKPTGGEEDGVSHEINDELYTTVEDALRTAEALGLGEQGRYLLAASFGNVHGVYKPGNVVLRPELLKDLQEGVAAKYGKADPFDFVFHGGSGSTREEIATALRNGVVKMNLDTDTQYAFTRPVAGHMFTNYDGVLKVDGDVGNKKAYDPRTWGKAAEEGMAKRVVESCEHLRSVGTSLSQ
jgi:fructose-bisphosphate aldolase, class II